MFAEARAEASGEGSREQEPFRELQGLLTEIRALRAQLERSIETSSMLQSKLEGQLAKGQKKAEEVALTLALQTLAIPERPLQPDRHGTAHASPLKMQPCACVWDVRASECCPFSPRSFR